MRLFRQAALRPALAAAILAGGLTAPAHANSKVFTLHALRPWTGDMDGMLKRHAVRILVPVSKTSFFIDNGVLFGIDVELGDQLEKWLNKRHAVKPYKIHVGFIPTPRDRLLSDLVAGKGDIAAGNLTITPQRQAQVAFAEPWASNISEVLVTGPSAPQIGSVDDLGGKTILVRKSSSYHTHLVALNETRKKNGKPLIAIKPADENLEDEDILEMVGSGMLPWAVVDRFKAEAWAKILKGLTVRGDIAINDGGEIAWAIRKDSPLLAKELGEFVAQHKIGTAFGNDLRNRYYRSDKMIRNALDSDAKDRLDALIGFFETSGRRHAIDPLMLAAQGYQESQLNQKLRSRAGAVGVMQVKPSTAREKQIGINDVVSSAENNIEAASKYLRFLAQTYINDPGVAERERVMMALAAYNAGPGNLKRFRKYAADRGLDPNVWFGNVEFGAAALIGSETVQYIGNIYKYYLAYSIRKEESQQAVKQ